MALKDRNGALTLVDHLLDKSDGATVISGIFVNCIGKEKTMDIFKCCNDINTCFNNGKKENENATMNKPICGDFDAVPVSLLCQIGF